ncbi:hypothetical protein MMC21_006996 [Puttea exsequens]|nr:hypothetical protein [Puttea exsequens]
MRILTEFGGIGHWGPNVAPSEPHCVALVKDLVESDLEQGNQACEKDIQTITALNEMGIRIGNMRSDNLVNGMVTSFGDSETTPYLRNTIRGERAGIRKAAAIIDAIIADPSTAVFMNRRGPETKDFPIGLLNRNVCLEVSEVPDPFEEHVRQIDPQDRFKETQEEEVSYTHLWSLDQIKYNKRSNEVLFQRTLMMSLIARHCLICDRKRVGQQVLDFNAEETWNCPPMPIWSYWQSCKLTLGTLLSQPRPDIALYFERETIIDNDSWNLTPSATKRLVCYENADPLAGITRVFHFLTIEAKKAMTPINDLKAFYQSLNNASQALHNMYEFLKDAGPKHENDFFTKVRFFSVVASSEGLTIRIHRATEIAADAPDGRFIMPLRRDYTPQFEHRVFAKIIKDTEFNRETFLKNFQKRTSYAMLELHPLLQNAAVVLIKQLGTSTNDFLARSDSDFYRYGQTNYELQRSKVGFAGKIEKSDLGDRPVNSTWDGHADTGRTARSKK